MCDFASRDRRWSQGNMQHLKILISKGLHPVSRVHFTIGVMSYLSSPLWLAFLVVGTAIVLGRGIFPPVYFEEVRTLFPVWPIFDKLGTITLFALSMFMLIFPKFLGLIVYLRDNKNKKKIGGAIAAFKSVIAEIAMSVLTAPIMMMFQSKFVFDIFAGNSVSWNTQNRDDTGTSFNEAVSRHLSHPILGIISTIVIWFYAPSIFCWMLPITFFFMFSLPISMFTSCVPNGYLFNRHKFFLIPE